MKAANDILGSAGKTPGSVVLYFPSKQDAPPRSKAGCLLGWRVRGLMSCVVAFVDGRVNTAELEALQKSTAELREIAQWCSGSSTSGLVVLGEWRHEGVDECESLTMNAMRRDAAIWLTVGITREGALPSLLSVHCHGEPVSLPAANIILYEPLDMYNMKYMSLARPENGETRAGWLDKGRTSKRRAAVTDMEHILRQANLCQFIQHKLLPKLLRHSKEGDSQTLGKQQNSETTTVPPVPFLYTCFLLPLLDATAAVFCHILPILERPLPPLIAALCRSYSSHAATGTAARVEPPCIADISALGSWAHYRMREALHWPIEWAKVQEPWERGGPLRRMRVRG